MPRDRRRRRHRHCRRHPGASIRRPSTAPAQRDARLSRDAQRRGEGGDMQQHVGRLVPELYLLGLTRTPVKRTRRRRRRRTQRRRDEVFQWAVDRGGCLEKARARAMLAGDPFTSPGGAFGAPNFPHSTYLHLLLHPYMYGREHSARCTRRPRTRGRRAVTVDTSCFPSRAQGTVKDPWSEPAGFASRGATRSQ